MSATLWEGEASAACIKAREETAPAKPAIFLSMSASESVDALRNSNSFVTSVLKMNIDQTKRAFGHLAKSRRSKHGAHWKSRFRHDFKASSLEFQKWKRK